MRSSHADAGDRRARPTGIRPIVAVYPFSGSDAADRRGADAVRLVRRVHPAGDPGRARRDRRQRAEPQSLLAAAVRAGRIRRGGARVPGAARGDVRRAEGGRRGRERDRRRARAPRAATSAGTARDDAFADDVHRGHGRRVPGERANAPVHGHVRAASVPGRTRAIRRRSPHPNDDDDRARGLRQARRAPRAAFEGGARPTLPIVYGEYGIETQIPARSAYTARAGVDEPVDERPRRALRQAIAIASASRRADPALPRQRRERRSTLAVRRLLRQRERRRRASAAAGDVAASLLIASTRCLGRRRGSKRARRLAARASLLRRRDAPAGSRPRARGRHRASKRHGLSVRRNAPSTPGATKRQERALSPAVARSSDSRASTSRTRSSGSIRPGAGCRSRSGPPRRTRSPRSSRSGRRASSTLARVLDHRRPAGRDFFLWKITERYEDLGELGAALNATPLAGWLETPYSYLATTKASQYTSARRARKITPRELAVPRRLPVREDAAVVRAPARTTASARWTSTSASAREFPSIHNHTTYSFGIDDQEFMTAFECDEPADFMHLMLTLRETEASRYTERDTPIFVGQHVADPRGARRASTARRRASKPERLSCSVCWSRQMRHIAKPQAPSTRKNASASSPLRRGQEVGAEVDDDQERRRRRRRARALVGQASMSLPPLAPEEEDEERDREEERDPREQEQRERASTAAWSTTTTSAIEGDDQRGRGRVGFIRREALMRSCKREPRARRRRASRRRTRQPRARLVRRVEPRREHGEQRERPVGVVELVGGAVVVGQQQQPEPDLRDEQGLREREQVRDASAARPGGADAANPPRAPTAHDARAPGMRSRGGPLASVERYPSDVHSPRGSTMVEEGKPAPDFELETDTGETVKL